ncbi:hypothetical protein E5F05_03095 (plasmid) [Deinococcus metallilatus]|uniref:CobQ/CobB/MinD/ParA nucleotide binding domain-containing protein n=1 Tax=Deinococcus metallilatus TaxID=1211322 RepID=A0AAJ5F6J1_9DEIO|nr:hypothetical protein E5F05_03095 [Deinococcus metallilatus]TLK32312.1 hypothetical protein FCS05_02430 [Deinococcus metallilatus]
MAPEAPAAVCSAQPASPLPSPAASGDAGGVGKSSSVRDIGFTLACLGHRVLLIDGDPQANLTDWLGVRSIDRNGVEKVDPVTRGLIEHRLEARPHHAAGLAERREHGDHLIEIVVPQGEDQLLGAFVCWVHGGVY